MDYELRWNVLCLVLVIICHENFSTLTINSENLDPVHINGCVILLSHHGKFTFRAISVWGLGFMVPTDRTPLYYIHVMLLIKTFRRRFQLVHSLITFNVNIGDG